MPRPTDGGTTYTFQLRPGIRHSTGQVVTPEDVRSSVERGFKTGSMYTQGAFWGVVGADACNRRPATCRLTKGIAVDPSANTVTFHLTEPDPDFLFNLVQPAAFVVPAREVGTTPLPATGPYMIQAFVPERRLTLVRNPQFPAQDRRTYHHPGGLRQVLLLPERLAQQDTDGAYWWQGASSPAGATWFLRCDAFEPDSIDNVNTSEFCNRELDRRIDHALSLQTTDPAKTGAAWAAVDRQIVDQAPAIGLLVPQGVDLVSKRVDNYQHNPAWGVVLSQLWVV